MYKYNIVAVYNYTADKILVCLRSSEPYKGLFNLPGGKVEEGEGGIDAAYRELLEETGISSANIRLAHVMDFAYPLSGCIVEAYAGRLNCETALVEEKHRLFWHSADANFFDMNTYAGEGNIGHMLEQVKLHMALIM